MIRWLIFNIIGHHEKKHLILLTFIPVNDYNLLFFSDETMNKIYEENGALDIIYQIPQILYSSIGLAIINLILKSLSLSEKNILPLKKQNNINK